VRLVRAALTAAAIDVAMIRIPSISCREAVSLLNSNEPTKPSLLLDMKQTCCPEGNVCRQRLSLMVHLDLTYNINVCCIGLGHKPPSADHYWRSPQTSGLTSSGNLRTKG
jgi:hypothetical protein